MNGMGELAFAVLACTVLFVGMLAVLGLLLVVNANRRVHHRAKVAEMELGQRQEVAKAEREAISHTLSEIGNELHDNVKHLLSVTLMGLSEVMAGTPGDHRLEAACCALELGMAEVDRLGRSLSTDIWAKRSLAEAIIEDAERLKRVAGIEVSARIEGTFTELPPDSSIMLYRAFQEVVSNILKHSRAKKVDITLAGPVFSLTIADYGRGFDLSVPRKGMGLANIRSRCALIGLEAICTTMPGKGCTWRFQQIGDRRTMP